MLWEALHNIVNYVDFVFKWEELASGSYHNFKLVSVPFLMLTLPLLSGVSLKFFKIKVILILIQNINS